MKKISIAWMLLASCFGAYAQSCCCTGAGANYSILPNMTKNVIGLRYSRATYFSVTQSLNPDLNGMRTDEMLNTLELFGRFNLNKRFQLSVFVPVDFIRQHSKEADNRTNSLGDMSFIAQYSILNPLKCNGKKSKHQLRVGVGTKLPSGDFKKDDNNLYSTSVQSGTGSIDFLANVIYTFRYEGLGLNIRAGYKLNTTNKYDFKFGNKADGTANLFYVIKAKEVSFMPSVGVTYAHSFENSDNGQDVYLSYSDLVTASISFDTYYKHFAVSLSAEPVVYNHVALRGFKQIYSLNAGVFYNF